MEVSESLAALFLQCYLLQSRRVTVFLTVDKTDFSKSSACINKWGTFQFDPKNQHKFLSFVLCKTGEEQLHLAVDRCAEPAEGAPWAAAQEEENQKYDYNRAQRPEDSQHAHTRHGESCGVGGINKDKHVCLVCLIMTAISEIDTRCTATHFFKVKAQKRDAWPDRWFAWGSCFYTSIKGLWRTFFLLSLCIETSSSLFALFFPLLPLAPCSSSLWRDSPMSFKMASVKLLATREGTNRCPCSFFQPPASFFFAVAGMFATTGVWFLFCFLLAFNSLLCFTSVIIEPLDFRPSLLFILFDHLSYFAAFFCVVISLFLCFKPRRHCYVITILIKVYIYSIMSLKDWNQLHTTLLLLIVSSYVDIILSPLFNLECCLMKIYLATVDTCMSNTVLSLCLTWSFVFSVPDHSNPLWEENWLPAGRRPPDPHKEWVFLVFFPSNFPRFASVHVMFSKM